MNRFDYMNIIPQELKTATFEAEYNDVTTGYRTNITCQASFADAEYIKNNKIWVMFKSNMNSMVVYMGDEIINPIDNGIELPEAIRQTVKLHKEAIKNVKR